MAEGHWQPARLIPTSGINGQDEAERRATSALLAVLCSVKEFGVAITKPLGAPAGGIGTFIEVPFVLGERTVFPDGVIEIGRAGRTWTALLEVKTGAAELQRDQVENYLDVARDNGFDVVLTVSNQLSPSPGVHPVEVDKRKVKKVALAHLSWAEILTVAVQQRVHRGVSDPDQAWILGELIRYLEHPKSGALDFSDMGGSWVGVRESITAGTLRPNDRGLAEVVSRWEQLLRFAALRLGRELGADVQVVVSRKEAAEPQLRLNAQAALLCESGTLTGTIRIPDAIAPIDVVADLRSGRVSVSVTVDAPRDGRQATRVNWLTRQLRDAPDGLRIDGYLIGSRTSTSGLLGAVRADPLVLIDDPKREFRSFRVAAASPLGSKRGTGRGSFIDSVLASVDGFYEAVVQQLRPWTAKAPQLSKAPTTAAEQAGIDITPPPSDLAEPHASATSPEIDVDLDVEGTDPGGDRATPDDVSAIKLETDHEIVSWESAHERLDHERQLESHAAVGLASPDEQDLGTGPKVTAVVDPGERSAIADDGSADGTNRQ